MRRGLKIVAWTVAFSAIVLLLSAGALYFAGNSDAGRGLIERLTARLTGGHVKVSGLTGAFPQHLLVGRLELRDERGIWLSAERVEIDWSPLALLGRRLQVDRLQAGRIDMRRLPESSASPEHDQPVSIPRIDVAALSVAALELGAPLAGAPASLVLTGSAHLRSVQDMAIEALARRTDGDGRYELHLRFDPRRMDAALTVHEPASGPLENLLQLPGLGALAATASVSGLRTAERLDVFVQAGELRARALGTVNLSARSGDLQFDVRSPAVSPRPGLGWEGATIKGRWHGPLNAPTADAHIEFAELRVPGGAESTALNAELSASAGKAVLQAVVSGLKIPGPQPQLLRGSPLNLSATLRLDEASMPVIMDASHKLFSLHAAADLAGAVDGTQNATAELRLADIAPFAALAGQELRGEALIKAVVKGGRNSLRMTADAAASLQPNAEFWSATVGERATLHLSAEIKQDAVDIDILKLNGRAVEFAASGNLQRPVAGAGPASLGKLSTRWDLRLTDLHALSAAFSGTLNASGKLAGPMASLTGDAHAASVLSVRGSPSGALSADIKLHGLPSAPVGTIEAQGTLDAAPLAIDVSLGKGDAGSLRALIRRIDWKTGHVDGDLNVAAGGAQTTGELRLKFAQLSDLDRLIGMDLGGSVVGTLALRSERQRTHATLELNGQSLSAGQFKGNAQISGEGSTDALRIKLGVQIPDLQGSDAALGAAGSVNLNARQLTVQTASATYRGQQAQLMTPAKIAFADGVAVDLLKVGAQKASFELRGKISPVLDARASIREIQPSLVNVFWPGLLESGTIEARARLRGSLATPSGEVRLSATGIRWGDDTAFGLPPVDLRANAQLAGSMADIDARLEAGDASKLALTGQAPLGADGPLQLKLAGTLDMGVINPLLEARGLHAAGQLAVDAKVTGTVQAPEIGGAVNLTEGSLRDYGRGVNVSGMTAEIVGSKGTLQIKSFTAAAAPGTLSMTGSVGVLQQGIPVDLTIKAQNAQPIVSKLVTANLDANLHVTGSAVARLDVGGTVHFNRTLIGIPNSLPPNVAVLDVRRRGKKMPVVADKPLVIGLDITVQAPQEILVQGRGLDAEVGGDLHLTGTADSPEVSGELSLRRGSFALASSRLNFTAGSVTFNGAGLRNKIDPNLDFTAQTSVGDVTAYLRITGPADAPQFEFTSNPAKQQEDIMALLLFGVPAANLSGLQLAQIGAALATLSGVGGDNGLNPLVKIQKSLGLDRLTVGAGTSNAAGTENTGASIEAGRYISRRVYVEAKQTTNGTSQLQADVDLTKHLTLQTRLGNGTASVQGTTPENDPGSSIGLIYKFEY